MRLLRGDGARGRSVLQGLVVLGRFRGLFDFVASGELVLLVLLLLLLGSRGVVGTGLDVLLVGTRRTLAGRVGHVGRSSSGDNGALGNWRLDELLAPGLLLLRLRTEFILGLLVFLVLWLGTLRWPGSGASTAGNLRRGEQSESVELLFHTKCHLEVTLIKIRSFLELT